MYSYRIFFGSWVPIIIGHDYFKNLYVLYIHVNSTCSRCCCSLPSFFEGCAPDLSQELGDGNEAEFQQYDCPMIQDFFVFWESASGWGRCFVDWMVVFSKKCSVMMVGCCRKKMLLQVFSYKALLCLIVHSHACQQMMPSPLCFQTLSWRFSVSRLVAIWGFTFLGHVFCGIFQLRGVFLSLEKLTLRSSINRRRWPKMVMLEKVMLWVGIHDIASCEVMQPELFWSRASWKRILVAFCCFYLSRCEGWKHCYEAKLDASCWTSPPGWTESFVGFWSS